MSQPAQVQSGSYLESWQTPRFSRRWTKAAVLADPSSPCSGDSPQGVTFSMAEAGKWPEDTCLVFLYSLSHEDDGWRQFSLLVASTFTHPPYSRDPLMAPLSLPSLQPETQESTRLSPSASFPPSPGTLHPVSATLVHPFPTLLSTIAPLQALSGLCLGLEESWHIVLSLPEPLLSESDDSQKLSPEK